MNSSNNSIILEGITSVSAVINSIRQGKHKRQIITVYFDKNKIEKERRRLAFLKQASTEIGFKLDIVSENVISELSTGKTHGGILAEVTQAQYFEIKNDDIKPDGFYAIIEGVEDPYSLGYSLRALYACGCDGVILPMHFPSAADSTLCKASAGASELLNIYTFVSNSILTSFKCQNYKIACAAIPESIPCFEADLTYPLLLIIGGEKRGISKKLLETADFNIKIPYGRDFLGSLSTASAVSILSYEVLRQNPPLKF